MQWTPSCWSRGYWRLEDRYSGSESVNIILYTAALVCSLSDRIALLSILTVLTCIEEESDDLGGTIPRRLMERCVPEGVVGVDLGARFEQDRHDVVVGLCAGEVQRSRLARYAQAAH